MAGYRSILVPVDFSEHSQRALEEAIALAGAFDAELHLLHCYPGPGAIVSIEGVVVPASLDRELRAAAGARLSEWADRARAAGCRVQEHLSAHPPAEEIRALAGKLGADLIVIGTRGLSGLKHVLLGSVAERTIRTTPCPVLTVKRDDAGG